MTQEKEESQFLKEIIQRIVDNPDKVMVEQEVDKQGVKLTLSVDPNDMGRLSERKEEWQLQFEPLCTHTADNMKRK